MLFVRGKRFLVRSDPPVFVQADGDIVGRTPMEIRVAPMAAEFLVPRREPSWTLSRGRYVGLPRPS